MDEPTPKYRVRIVRDTHPCDPRDDNVSEITSVGGGRSAWRADHLVNLLSQTDAYDVVFQMLDAADPDGDADGPDLYDPAVREAWLEAVKDELKVLEFQTQHNSYVAHITPAMCGAPGVSWDTAQEVMEAEVGTFKMWAEGDVYGFVVEVWKPACSCEACEAGDWEEVDSCWGFYGSDPFENGMSDHIHTNLHDLLRAATVEYS